MDKMNKDIDKLLYSEKSLYLLNIRELRDMGRKFGVPAPASMKKQELVDYILKIVYGEVVVPARSLRGRPNVREFDMNKYLDKIKKNSELTSELVKVKLDTNYDLSQFAMVSAPSTEYSKTLNIKQRVFYDSGDKYYLRVRQFIESPDDIVCSKDLKERFSLENFDIVEVLESDEFFKILTINGKKLEDKLIDLLLDSEPIERGKQQDFYLRTKEEIEERIEKLVDFCEKSGINLFVFGTKKYTGNTVETVVYNNNDGEDKVYKNFMLFLNLCEQAMLESQDFIVVIQNYADIVKFINSLEPDVMARAKELINYKVDKMLSLENVWISFKLQENKTY